MDAMLEIMQTTGGARLDREGSFIPSGEYVAALYESYAVDHEFDERYGGGDRSSDLWMFGAYVDAAQRIAEGLWTRDIQSVMAEYADNHMEW